MRLKIETHKISSQIISCVCWLNSDEVLATGDDQILTKWKISSNQFSNFLKLPNDFYPISMSLSPKNGQIKNQEIVSITSSDGKVLLINKSGKVEKLFEAHLGTVLCLSWASNGSFFLTGGEDGSIKQWSPIGMLRSCLVQSNQSIYSLSCSPSNQLFVYPNDRSLIIKSLLPNINDIIWKGHEGIILSLDWNSTNHLILSSSEDCKFKIWDSLGRQMYSSNINNFIFPIISACWQYSGQFLICGFFGGIKLSDKYGSSHELIGTGEGSVYSLKWNQEGNSFVGGSGIGQLILGLVSYKKLDYLNFEVTMTTNKEIKIRDVLNNSIDKIEFNNGIIDFNMAYNNLIVITNNKCYIYGKNNWNTPLEIQLKDKNITKIIQSPKLILLLEKTPSLLLYTYSGKLQASIKNNNIIIHPYNNKFISLNDEIIIIRDAEEGKKLFIIDINNNKIINNYEHDCDIEQIGIERTNNSSNEKIISFIDKNNQLYLISVRIIDSNIKILKIGKIVEDFIWHDKLSIMVITIDNHLFISTAPVGAFVDKNLYSASFYSIDNLTNDNKINELISLNDNQLKVKLNNGSNITIIIDRCVLMLIEYITKGGRWKEAVKICRLAQKKSLWCCLSLYSIYYKQLDSALLASIALSETDKIHYLTKLQNEPNKIIQSAFIMLISGGNLKGAESILIQNKLIFMSIIINIQAFQWLRALEIATKYKTHIDTVLFLRKKYIKNIDKKEFLKEFKLLNEEVSIDEEKVMAKIKAEYKK